MERGERAVVLVGMLTHGAKALATDAEVEPMVCRHLAESLDADAAACFVPADASRNRVLACHPNAGAARELVNLALSLRADQAGRLPQLVEHGQLGEVLVIAPREVESQNGDLPRRALAFAKQEGFDDHNVLLLREAIPPLMALLPHAIVATETRERVLAGKSAAAEFGLTGRELEVLELLSQGLLATSIASRLDLSPRTIHKHLGNIYDKLGVHDRLVAVDLARGRGLVAA